MVNPMPEKAPSTVVYYITAHGYGHGVRSCDILRALRREDPACLLKVVTDLPLDFLRSRLDLPPECFRPGSFDVGMVQLDSIRVDVQETWRRVGKLMDGHAGRIEQERAFLRACGAGLVVSDIPAIPLEAAAAEGIPGIAVGNFAWDWIYEEFAARDARWAKAVEAFREGYGKADLLLRLPFAEQMEAFPVKKDLPLVATPGRDRREEIATACGIDPNLSWVLLSFTSLDWDQQALSRVGAMKDVALLTVLPLQWTGANFFPVDRHRFSVSDIIASVDTVVSKPGFGILSECVVNGRPLVYAERTDFREYPVLEEAIRRYLRHVHIPARELYAGNLQPYLAAVGNAAAPPESLRAGGDREAAGILLEHLHRKT